ncbi:IS3 family transposase [Corynebacterium macclintockiae]|uniref:IS3 family transposase n=1 Tax=Corynebacterium macclintockiae TaxID=2913501 RepID=UPI0032B7BB1C
MKNNRAGRFITSRGYRQSKTRGLSARRRRDAVLVERISAIHRDNYGLYGVRKMWHALRRDGIDIGREQTARLMRLAGICGKGKGRSPMTTRTPQRPDLRPDLVEREFKAQGLNKLRVADITYVRTKERLYVCRVCHRRLFSTDRWVGVIRLDADFKHCHCKLSTRRSCVLEKQQVSFTIQITAHSMSAWSTTSDLPSTGLPLPPEPLGILMTMLLAENVNGSYKNELIHTRRWDDVVEVEIATFEWVSWWNEDRLHQSLGYRTPAEVETEFWRQNPPQAIIEIKANA